MNIIHGMNSVSQILPRLITPALRTALDRFPVVVLTGARQTGKSTLVSSPSIGSDRLYRTLDDFDVFERAREAPDALLQDSARLTVDEVQRLPDLLHEIKRIVDRRRTAGRFLLTGSANLLLMKRVSESLAGRAVYLHLWPMTESEKAGRPHVGPWSELLAARCVAEARDAMSPGQAVKDWPARLIAGGYPVAALALAQDERSQWFDGYIRTYLERDLQEVASIAGLADFRRLMRLAALRTGKLLNQTELARDAGLSQPTAHRYLNLLETSYQIVRVPPYAVSQTRRLVKTPKLYWTDTGLAAHLAGIDASESLLSSSLAGALFENLVLLHLLAWRETLRVRPEVLYWRSHAGEEVDLVLESGRRLLPIEVKLGKRAGLNDVRGLRIFLDDYSDMAPFGVVLYGGAEVFLVTDNILALPSACLF
jgi:predicted AAA+ superfamily ATPase